MKHIFFALVALFCCSYLHAQTALTSAFGTATLKNGIQLEFSIGEMSNVETIKTTKPGELKQITQGYLQPQTVVAKPRVAVQPTFTANLSPNPATDQVQLTGNWQHSDQAICTMLNAEGKMVMAQTIQGPLGVFQISNLTPGVYFLKVEVNNMVETKRFVKTH